MKKLWIYGALVLAALSCSVDEDTVSSTENENLTTQITKEFRGVFTTLDGTKRAKVFIEIPRNELAIARFEMHDGQIHWIKAVTNHNAFNTRQPSNGIVFENENIHFEVQLQTLENTITINQVSFFGKEGDIIALHHTSRAPVTPVTGTYECGTCNGHPVLGNVTQTFNMVFAVADGTGSITTQSTLGATIYNGIGYQDNCVANGTLTTCNLESGDGSTTTTGHTANGNPVTWSGTHTFNNEPSGPNDCSGVTGSWQWQSNSYGFITGTFVSDVSCPPTTITLYSENFQTFTGAGFTPSPAPGQLDSNIIVARGLSDGDVAYGDTETSGDFARGTSTGGVSSGGIYAFDTGSSNIMLGVQPAGSDFTPGEFEIRIENTTGSTLKTFNISYNIWVNNDQGRANTLNFSYSTDGSTFTPVGGLDYTSPAGSDGNGFVSVARSDSFSATVNDRGFIYIRFESDDSSGSGSRDELGIDDILLEGN